ncbi:hypothetical protein SH591_08745 [Sphingomonas sp. LY54]|uniref:hypothetical protein n=1 Tax=Sphingomonas sp. LY54 TaxID=3095343 RepID=UPI002D76569A|nr:hypothetical protein [Sphingomonas sp. LY54]WRP27211.1 hypothetical protein SH591_08745 [Sphingomonas sp. LY54]
MASWLSSWLTYYRRLYVAGAMVLLLLCASAFVAFLAVFVPLVLTAGLVGWDVGQAMAALVAAVVALPAALGGTLRYVPKGYGAPPRPPSWRLFKAGVFPPQLRGN